MNGLRTHVHAPKVAPLRHSLLRGGVATLLLIGACSDGGPKSTLDGTGGSGSTGGTTATGGIGAGSGGTGGSATGGATPPATGGSASTGGAHGGASTGGASATGGSGGRGGGGGGTGAATGGGSGNGTGCTRDFLKSTIDAYFKALAAHDPSTLPLADNVKFTENSKVSKVGEAGLWKTAGALKYAHSALDPDGCNTTSEAVVPDGTTDLPVAVRLKLQNQKITEIESIVVRAGDYKVSGSNFASNTAAIIASGTSVKWEDPVPMDQRNTKEELTGWMDKYFKAFPAGVCNTDSTCKRLENGGGSFNCSAGASCQAGAPTGKPVLTSHIIFADVERGIGVGFDIFMGNTDMHMFKMYGGKVYAVHAILGAATTSGWE